MISSKNLLLFFSSNNFAILIFLIILFICFLNFPKYSKVILFTLIIFFLPVFSSFSSSTSSISVIINEENGKNKTSSSFGNLENFFISALLEKNSFSSIFSCKPFTSKIHESCSSFVFSYKNFKASFFSFENDKNDLEYIKHTSILSSLLSAFGGI